MSETTGLDAAAMPLPEAPARSGVWPWLCRLVGALVGVWVAPPWLR